MAYPRDQGTLILDTYASDSAVGAVLSQIQDGEEKVISNGYRTLNRAESNYCVIDKEFLAIRYFTEYYRQYLLSHKFTTRTDHQALIWLFKWQNNPVERDLVTVRLLRLNIDQELNTRMQMPSSAYETLETVPAVTKVCKRH